MFDELELSPPRDVPLAMVPKGTRPVDPNGWDVVSAIRIRQINDAIRNAGTSPTSFSGEPAPGAAISGGFRDWSLSPDGNGQLINLSVPIRDVTVSYNGVDATLAEARVEVRVQLEYMPAGPRMMATPGGGQQEVETHLLVIKLMPDTALLGAAGEPRVANVLSIEGGRDLPTMHYAVLKTGLDEWFNDNLAAFQHVFAAVNVVRTVHEDTDGGFDWMNPSTVSYAFGHNSMAPEDSVLTILCMTGGRKADGLVAQAQSAMVPEGADAALCVSRQRIARDMIGKGLPAAFDGLEAKDLAYSAKDTTVTLKKRVKLQDVEDPKKKGKKYSPYLERMRVNVGELDVKLESETKTNIEPGVWSVVNTIDTYTYGLATNSKGQKTIAFKQLSHDDKRQTEQSQGSIIGEIVASILGAIGLAVATVLTGGAALVVAAVSAVLLVGVITRDAIKLISGNDGPPIDLLLTNATQAVSWSDASRFDPVFVGLNGGLQIGGVTGKESALLGAEDPAQARRAFQAPFAGLMAARARIGAAK